MIGVKIPASYKDDLVSLSHEMGMSHSHLLRLIITKFVDHAKSQEQMAVGQ